MPTDRFTKSEFELSMKKRLSIFTQQNCKILVNTSKKLNPKLK